MLGVELGIITHQDIAAGAFGSAQAATFAVVIVEHVKRTIEGDIVCFQHRAVRA